jgi:hypothetical protein
VIGGWGCYGSIVLGGTSVLRKSVGTKELEGGLGIEEVRYPEEKI